uniref:Ground-like domain-containing protein n=1 Tax=Meloidogyne hapla TaxID=6305 RepID=A0A1I8B1S0_MELHA
MSLKFLLLSTVFLFNLMLILKTNGQLFAPECSDDSAPHCILKRSSNKRTIREVPFDSDEDATGGGTASADNAEQNSNFDGDGAKEEENPPDTMMIYDDDSPVTESEAKEGKDIKTTANNQQQTSTIKSTIGSSTSTTIKAETTKITTNNLTKNLTNNKSEKSPKVLEEMKKLSGKGKLVTLNSDKNETPVGINNNINSEKVSFKNEENNKSKSHRRNCNSELIRRIILEVFNDNNIGNRPSVAKRKIQSKATEQVGGRIDVICSRKAFSYVVNSEVFCEVEKADIVCLCYKQQG